MRNLTRAFINLPALLLVCLIVPFISGSSTFAQENSCPVEVADLSWRGAYCIGAHCTSQGAFSAKMKNLTDKTVFRIDWEYVLTDSVRKREYDRLKFTTDDKKIKPKQIVKYTKRFDYPDPPDYIKAHVEIKLVVFTDGTIWREGMN